MEDPASAFEYLLQRSPLPNWSLVQNLLRAYYAEIDRFLFSILDDPESADEATYETFQAIIERLETYPIGTDLDVWIRQQALRIARRRIRKRRLRSVLRRLGRFIFSVGTPRSATRHEPVGSSTDQRNLMLGAVASLPERYRIPLLLRFAHNMSLAEISTLLGIRQHIVIDQLEKACAAALGLPTHTKTSDLRTVSPHRSTRRALLSSEWLDEENRALITRHLVGCQDCTSFHQRLTILQEALQLGWRRQVTDRSSAQLAAALLAGQRETRSRLRGMYRGIREVLWVALAIIVAATVGLAYDRFPSLSDFEDRRMTIRPPELPAIAESQPVEILDVQENTARVRAKIFDSDWSPVVSGNGRWIAFASIVSELVRGDTNGMTDVFLQDRQTGVVQRVSVASDGSQSNHSSAQPSISGDGRYIVFVSLASNLVFDDTNELQDVFIHDRQRSRTRRISLGFDGSNADGKSLAPSISDDGRWIAFWSSASNLVSPQEGRGLGQTACGADGRPHRCFDIYLYDRRAEAIERIPVGRPFDRLNPFMDTLSISGDGTWILFRADSHDDLGDDLGLTNSQDVFLYNRITGSFESINQRPDGEVGNGPSYTAEISNSGRWIAFASEASNLVPDDTNDAIDVFLLDRQEREIRRVSLTQDGSQADRDSGVILGWDFHYGDGLSLSADGRWVLYSSRAENLVMQEINPCILELFCQNLYLYDRVVNESAHINQFEPGPIPSASLASDGSLVAYQTDIFTCFSGEICTNVYLYEPRTGHTSSVDLSAVTAGEATLDWVYKQGLRTHQGWVNAIAFSPDSQLLATGSNDGTVRIWSVENGRLIGDLRGHTRAVNSLEFSPDGNLLAVGVNGTRVYLWRVQEQTLHNILVGNPGAVRNVTFSPDGGRLAAASADQVWLWSITDMVVLRRNRYPGSNVMDVEFSPDGEILAVAAGDDTVWLQRSSENETLLRIGDHAAPINTISFSSDGHLFATGSRDNTLNVWQIERQPRGQLSASLVKSLRHRDWVSSVAFSMDSGSLAAASYDGDLSLWEVEVDRVELLPHPKPVRSNQLFAVEFSPDGRYLAAGMRNGFVHLWQNQDAANSS